MTDQNILDQVIDIEPQQNEQQQIAQVEQPQFDQPQIEQPQIAQPQPQFEQPILTQPFFDTTQSSNPSFDDYFQKIMNWFKTNMSSIIKVIIILVILWIIIYIFKKLTKENFSIETPNGIIQQDMNVVGQKVIQTTRFGGSEMTQEIKPDGVDMSSIINSDNNAIAIKSSKQADINIQKEMYNNMNANLNPDESNMQESSYMDMLKNQSNNIQIQKNNNLSNSAAINTLDLIKQQNIQRQMPLQDVNELEQMNRLTQTNMDHKYMIQGALGANMQLAPNDPNEIIKNQVKYTKNSNRPTYGIYDQPQELIHEEIEFTPNLNFKKESVIKSNGMDIKLPSMKSVEQEIKTSIVTKEPVIQMDQQKVILDQKIVQTPDKKEAILIEKTVNPEIVAKVEESYSRWPITLATKQQKQAAGQFMTIIVLMKYAGKQIPDLQTLINEFPVLNNMKPSGPFKKFDRSVIQWANEQIRQVNTGEKNLNDIITQFKAKYNIDPIQKVQTGKQNPDGSITKDTQALQNQTPPSSNGEKFQGMKRKYTLRHEHYTVYPGRGIKQRQVSKQDIIV